MAKRLSILCFIVCICQPIFAQQKPLPEKKTSRRIWFTTAANAAFWSGSYVALNQAWYKGYAHTPFHFFNDNSEWNQMDKAGHAWTSYTLARTSARMWKWAGLSEYSSAIVGGASGLLYQSIIELQDAHSAQWGFSWGDMAANAFGAALFSGQELIWHKQRIQLKLSYTSYRYPAALSLRRDDLFGDGMIERILKDYNGQTYWLSVNLQSMLPASGLPGWLNVAVGYGSDGLLGARSNRWNGSDGEPVDFTAIPRTRRFWISPDLDLTRIETHSKLLRTVFFLLNSVKIPAPAIELNSRGKLLFHAVRF